MPAGLGLRSGVVSPQRYVANEFSSPNFLRIFCAGATGLFVSMAARLIPALFPLLSAQFLSFFAQFSFELIERSHVPMCFVNCAQFHPLSAQFPSRLMEAIRLMTSRTPSYGSVFSVQCSQ